MKISVKVYQHDVDWGGVLYHANHVRLFDMARAEWWSNIGFPGHLFGSENQLAFAVANAQVRYIAPAFLHDELHITTHLHSVKDTSLLFKQSLWKADDCLAEAEFVLVCVNITNGRPMKLPLNLCAEVDKYLGCFH